MHSPSTMCVFVVLAAGASMVAACGGAGDPLGGPYGGTGTAPPASSADLVDMSGGDEGGTTGSSSGTTSSSSGSSSSSSSSGVTHTGSSGGSGSGSSSGVTGHSSSSSSSSGSSSGSSSSGSSSSGSSSGSTTGASTWSQIYSKYLGFATVGNCQSCHNQMSSATSSYSWLKGRNYINGTSSTLVNPAASDLSWYGGNMPPGGGKDAQAVTDMNAWAAAGALDN